MVGDAQDVEAMRSIEVDEVGERQPPVAPGGVRVEFAQEQIASLLHRLHFRQCGAKPRVERVNIRPQPGEGLRWWQSRGLPSSWLAESRRVLFLRFQQACDARGEGRSSPITFGA